MSGKRRKMKRATQEEILMFEQSMNSRGDMYAGESCAQVGSDLGNFSWLDETTLSALPFESLLGITIQYRDLVMGLMDDRKVLTESFLSIMERNNILLTDTFGRKSEKLKVLLGISKPGEGQKNKDQGQTGDEKGGGKEPVKSSGGEAEKEKDGHDGKEPSEEGDIHDGKTENNGNGEEEVKKRTWKPTRSKGCIDKQCEGLPVIEQFIEMTDEELESFFGKGNYRRMESNDREITEYEYIPRTLYVRKTILCAYEAEDKAAEDVKKEMVIAKNPVVRLRQHSRETSSIWAHLYSMRFSLRLTWNRVASDFATDGLRLTTQMMEENAWYFYGILTAAIQRMWYWLLVTGYIQIDETPVLMYDQNSKTLFKRYFWVFTVSELHSTDKKVTIFVYAEGRDTGVLRKYLVEDHKYTGYATTDGHNPYHVIDAETGGAVRNTGCLNHFRTKLVKVLKAIPNLKKMSKEQLEQIPAFNALSSLQIVFKKESETAGMSAEERKEFRMKNVMPELKAAFSVLEDLEADDYSQGSLMHKVLTYRDNQQDYLTRFLEDGNIPLTNSNSERHIAFFALLRNVSRLFGSDEMGSVGAGWETLAQTAKAYTDHIDIYFQYLLDEAVPFITKEDALRGVKHTAKSHLSELERNALAYFGDERLDRFMPWSEEYRKYEKKVLNERRKTAEFLARVKEDSAAIWTGEDT